jgi:hypothetical protein
MTNGGGTYSIDGSYDLVWDGRFPIDGNLLWPKGRLLQLQRLAFSSHLLERRHIIFLTPGKLVIAEQTKADPDLPYGVLDDGKGYRFYTLGTRNEKEYDSASISKVELGRSLNNMGIGIWTWDDRRRSKKIFKAHGMGVPKALEDVADESIRQGIARPTPKFLEEKEINVFRSQLLYREVERQLRRVAPQAEIVLVGEHMPEEDFRRIIR